MKKLLLLILICPLLVFSQVATIDFHFINDGMKDDYLEVEKVWVEFHKQNIEDGKMFGWSLFKIESTSNNDSEAPDYMTLNRFESKEAMESMWNGVTPESFMKIVKNRLKGKISARKIKKILEAKVKKSVHTYTIKMKDQTVPPVEMKIGETLNISAMEQKVDDYDKYESFVAKPIVQSNVNDGNLKWWGFTEVTARSDDSLKEVTHFTWQIPVDGKNVKWFDDKASSMFGGKFTFDKLANLVGESREIVGSTKLKLIMTEK